MKFKSTERFTKDTLFLFIRETLKEGLDIISQYEKLSHNEGQISVLFPLREGEFGIEIYAPHLIPNALSHIWMGKNHEEAFTRCLKDLESWVEIEKECPRDKFLLDFYR